MKLFILFALLSFLSCSSSNNVLRNLQSNATDEFILLTPMRQENSKPPKIKLINKRGKILKEWDTELIPFDSKLDKDGNIYISGQSHTKNKYSYIARGMYDTIELQNKKNQVLWRYSNPLKHHDFTVLPNGNIAVISFYKINSSQVKFSKNKGVPKKLWADKILEIEPKTNKVIWEWKTHKYIKVNEDDISSTGEIFHCNSINYISSYYKTKKPAFLLSSRNNSKVYIIDKETKKIIWESSKGLFIRQHDPTFIDDRNIMVFSNGHKHSKIKEVNTETNEVVWEYFYYFRFTWLFS